MCSRPTGSFRSPELVFVILSFYVCNEIDGGGDWLVVESSVSNRYLKQRYSFESRYLPVMMGVQNEQNSNFVLRNKQKS